MESQESIIPNQPAPAQDNGALVTNEQTQAAAPTETPTKKKSKAGVIIIIIVVVLLVIGAIVGLIIFLIAQENARQEAFKEDAKSYIKVVATAEENALYYPFTEYGKKAQLENSPYDRKYLDDSYVTNYYDHTYICLTDGEKRIQGYADSELELEDASECEYQFQDHSKLPDSYNYNEKQVYLEAYASKEYKFLTPSVESADDKYQVKSKYFDFDIDATLADHKITIDDSDFEAKEEKFYTSAKGTTIAEYFLKKYFKTDNLRDDSPVTVPEINSLDGGVTEVRVYTESNYETTKKMMLEYLELIKKHKVNMPGVVLDLYHVNQQSYKLEWYVAVGQRIRDGEYTLIENSY